MLEIKSAIKSNVILSSYFNSSEVNYERMSMTNNDDLLQVGVTKFSQNFGVKAHKHLPVDRRNLQITQELWILIKGAVTVEIYDVDDSLVKILEMNSGDMLLYKNGGHSFITKSVECILYEVKNGPYFGPGQDKQYI